MKYYVEIEETLSRTIEVEAESAEDAEMIARQMYRDCEVVLTADDFTGSAEFRIVNPSETL